MTFGTTRTTQRIVYAVPSSVFRQKKLSIVFESARDCQGMVLQLVFDPLAYLQYSALPDHRPGPAASTNRLERQI